MKDSSAFFCTAFYYIETACSNGLLIFVLHLEFAKFKRSKGGYRQGLNQASPMESLILVRRPLLVKYPRWW